MTLRTRLLISLLAVLTTLAAAALIVARSQQATMIDQIDRRLSIALPPALTIAHTAFGEFGGGYGPNGSGYGAGPFGGMRPGGGGSAANPSANPDTSTTADGGTDAGTDADTDAGALSELFVGSVGADGTITRLLNSKLYASGSSPLELPPLSTFARPRLAPDATAPSNGTSTSAAPTTTAPAGAHPGGTVDAGTAPSTTIPSSTVPSSTTTSGLGTSGAVSEDADLPYREVWSDDEGGRSRFEPFTVRSIGGQRVRVVLVQDRTDQLFVVGLPLEQVDDAYRRLLLGFLAAGVALLAVTCLAGWWVVRLGLRPIRTMTEAADAIARGETDRRVAHPSPRTEAGRLGRAFNVMLDERQGAEDRLRRFVSDASHELRTPLTSIRGYIDLYRRGGLRGDGELDDAMRRIAGEGARMGTLVDDLLLLARLDEGRPLADAPVELADLLRDAAADTAALHPDRPITSAIDERLPVRGDEARLRQVIGALVTNALVHTAPGTAVGISGHRQGDVHVVEVSDRGEGMNPEVAGQVFERFYRGDPARTRHTGGSGLGLAIVRSIVEAHGGTVSLESVPDHGTTVRVVLPAAPRRSAGRGGTDVPA